jgi:hypothetical protein
MPDVRTLKGVLKAKLVGMLLGFPGILFLTATSLLPATDIPAIFVPTNILKAVISRLAFDPLAHTPHQVKFSPSSLLPASSFSIVFRTINPHSRPSLFTLSSHPLPQSLEEQQCVRLHLLLRALPLAFRLSPDPRSAMQ